MAKRTPAPEQPKEPDQPKELEQPAPMNVELVPVDSVSPDPANARAHGPKNLDAIKSSLRRFGQQKPIVIDGHGIVRAGNGTLEAAKSLGWKMIQVVRSPLTGSEATAYAIADNRTGELAEWDNDVLAEQLGSLHEEGVDLNEIGFDAEDLKKLLGEEPAGGGSDVIDEKWMVAVTCRDEEDQRKFLEEMNNAGRECRALIG